MTVAADHAGLALMPVSLALTEPSKHKGPVTFNYEIVLDQHVQQVRITLQPGESGELPVHGDQLVYLSLLQLALRQPDPQPVLQFHRTEVFELLRWPKRGQNYDRLRDSLRRLWDLGIVIESALVSRGGQSYGRETEMTKLINRVRIGSGRDANCEVEWGSIVRQAFAIGDFKRLDWDLMMALGNPMTAQLYRLLDRVTMYGQQSWEVDWHDLSAALGMNTASYARPARLKQVLAPHIEALMGQGVLDGVDYRRGGKFVFHVRNYLRFHLRRVLQELGVYERVAAQVLNGHDEVAIMLQCDCLEHGCRPAAKAPAGYIVEAIRNSYELRYPPEEAQAFAGLWGLLLSEERTAYHAAGVKLCGAADSLFDTRDDPTAWSLEMRAVVRFLVHHNLDPEQMMGSRGGLRQPPMLPG